jgi:hypothetical protein
MAWCILGPFDKRITTRFGIKEPITLWANIMIGSYYISRNRPRIFFRKNPRKMEPSSLLVGGGSEQHSLALNDLTRRPYYRALNPWSLDCQIQLGKNGLVCGRSTTVDGWGLFTARSFMKHAVLCMLGPPMLTTPEVVRFVSSDNILRRRGERVRHLFEFVCVDHRELTDLNDEAVQDFKWVDITAINSPAAFINSSLNPNAFFSIDEKSNSIVKSSNSIAAYTEIFVQFIEDEVVE